MLVALPEMTAEHFPQLDAVSQNVDKADTARLAGLVPKLGGWLNQQPEFRVELASRIGLFSTLVVERRLDLVRALIDAEGTTPETHVRVELLLAAEHLVGRSSRARKQVDTRLSELDGRGGEDASVAQQARDRVAAEQG